MKLNSDFRLSKEAKRRLALMYPTDKEKTNLWKKSYIEAELALKDAKTKKLIIPKGEE